MLSRPRSNQVKLANYEDRRAPFTCDAWNSPRVLAKISEVAGIELTPAMDYEIAAINISVNDQTVAIVSAPKVDDDNCLLLHGTVTATHSYA